MLIGIARGHVRLALVFLLVGGLLGLIARVQLMQPAMNWIGGSELPGLLTLHALTLVLLSLLPLQTAGFLATLPAASPSSRLIRWPSWIGLGMVTAGAVAVYVVIGVQVASDGLAGLPTPRWLGGIGGKIPPILPTDGPFLLALTLLCFGHAVSGLGLVGAGASALRNRAPVHGALTLLTGLGLVVLFGGFVFGIFAHAARAELGLARPLWWELFGFFEAPLAFALVAPLLWLVLRILGPRPDPGEAPSTPARAFAATAVVLVSAAAALGSVAGAGYRAVLTLHVLYIGALLFGGFAVLYQLWPVLFERQPRSGTGLMHWALTLVSGAVLLAGLAGLTAALAPRRVALVPELPAHELWHMVASCGAFALGGAVVGGLALGLLAAPRAPHAPRP